MRRRLATDLLREILDETPRRTAELCEALRERGIEIHRKSVLLALNDLYDAGFAAKGKVGVCGKTSPLEWWRASEDDEPRPAPPAPKPPPNAPAASGRAASHLRFAAMLLNQCRVELKTALQLSIRDRVTDDAARLVLETITEVLPSAKVAARRAEASLDDRSTGAGEVEPGAVDG